MVTMPFDNVQRIFQRFLVLLLTVFAAVSSAVAQSFSNAGTEFYTLYAEHIYPARLAGTNTTNSSYMLLYLTSDKDAVARVELMDGSFSQQYTVPAHQVVTVPVSPSASLKGVSQVKSGKSVHITSDVNISVFAHIYGNTNVGVSGATMVLPVNALGKDYRSVNFTQTSNSVAFGEGKSYCFFNVVATADNTTIEITPQVPVYNGDLLTSRPAGTPYIITLSKKGDVYQGLADRDLTGTRIRAVAPASAVCNPIAVFCGSSKTSIVGGVSACTVFQTADNLFQQVYPVSSWGTRFATVPLAGRETGKDIYRVVLSDPNTVITGVPAYNTADLQKGYIEFVIDQPMVINASKPVQVAQYAVSQFAATCSNLSGDLGDPEMIYLNPVEQAITGSTFYAAGRFAITNSYLNVTIPADGVASFKLDGQSVPAASFKPIPGNAAYAYAQLPVTNGPQATGSASATAGAHYISAGKPFNAIVYGFGPFESYGYSAGASFTKLNEAVALKDGAGNTTPAESVICSGAGYTPQLTLPYRVNQITWRFDNGTSYVQNNPSFTTSTSYNQPVYTYGYFNAAQNTDKVFLAAGLRKIIASVVNNTTGCGTDDNEMSITVTDAPIPTFTATGNCIGEPISFTANTPAGNNNITSVLWNFGDGTSATTLNASHVYTAVGDYNVQLTVNYKTGCSITSAVQIQHIIAKPVAAFTYSSPDCAASAITFKDASTTAGSTVTAWAWKFGDGSTSDLQNPTHTYASAGKYTVSLQVTNGSGCMGAAITQNVVVNPVPVVTITPPQAICQDASSVTITANKNGIDGTGIFSGNGITAAGVFDPAKAGVGTHTISYIFTAATGCIFSQTFTVTVTAKPAVPAFTFTGTCADGTTTFTAAQSDNSNTYSWDFGDSSIITGAANISHKFISPGDYKVVLTITNTNGCSAVSAAQNIHINKHPLAGFNTFAPACAGTSITFADISTDPEGGSIATWAWDFGDGGTSALQNPSHTYSEAKTYVVKLVVTTQAGCQSLIAIQNVVINPVPVVTITPPPAICQDAAPVAITANKNGINGTEIFSGNGITAAGVFDPAKAGVGTHTMSYIFTAASGCTVSQTFTITVTAKPALPTFAFTGTCADGTTTFTVAQSDNSGVNNYSWDFGDGNIITGTATIGHKFTGPGDYKVVLTVTNTNGCSAISVAQNIHINKKPVAAYNYTTPGCSGVNMVFTDASTDPENVTINHWAWDFGDGSTSSAQNPAHVYTQAGSYTVSLTVTNNNGCQSAATLHTVVIQSAPQITVAQPPPVCMEENPFTVAVNTNGVQGIGVFKGDGISAAGLFNPYKAGVGIHAITYTFTAQAGCDFVKKFNIVVYRNPTLGMGDNITLLDGDSTVLKATASGDGLTYKWYPSAGLSRDDVPNPVATPLNDTKYTLTVTSISGCTVSGQISVTVLKAPKINNTFTPNGDGINDLWNIDLLSNYPQSLINIYTRNGEKVFSSVGYSVPWDGKFNGSDLATGVYYYIIDLKTGKKPIAGYVTIVR